MPQLADAYRDMSSVPLVFIFLFRRRGPRELLVHRAATVISPHGLGLLQ